ncbi:MAG: hypothetical protein CV089_23925 [Nitrospira sp. WS110]|nr:hypothetical protein [Nitrospira sp. WS110]
MRYRIYATDGRGNVETGYEEILEGASAREVETDWIHLHCLTAEGPECFCGKSTEWADGYWSCPDYLAGNDEHYSRPFEPEAEEIE